jgi:hypothetical protein
LAPVVVIFGAAFSGLVGFLRLLVVDAKVVVTFVSWVMFHGLALRVVVDVRVCFDRGVLFGLLACWGW